MRESFGGAFMIKIVMVFIIVYISFMAVAINYAKAFRVKNNVINILEQYKYSGGGSGEKAIKKLEDYLPSVPYNLVGIKDKLSNSCKNSADGKKYHFMENGVCIIQNSSGSSNAKYFRVITYISIDFPFFNIHMTFPITGETKSIYS